MSFFKKKDMWMEVLKADDSQNLIKLFNLWTEGTKPSKTWEVSHWISGNCDNDFTPINVFNERYTDLKKAVKMYRQLRKRYFPQYKD